MIITYQFVTVNIMSSVEHGDSNKQILLQCNDYLMSDATNTLELFRTMSKNAFIRHCSGLLSDRHVADGEVSLPRTFRKLD